MQAIRALSDFLVDEDCENYKRQLNFAILMYDLQWINVSREFC